MNTSGPDSEIYIKIKLSGTDVFAGDGRYSKQSDMHPVNGLTGIAQHFLR